MLELSIFLDHALKPFAAKLIRIPLNTFNRLLIANMESFLPDAADADSPLKSDELQVLRAQYEKEGYYVGVQTKFNYAWVRHF